MTTHDHNLDDPGVMEVTGKVLIATIIALFLLLVLVFCFHLYAKWLWHRRQQAATDGLHNHRRQDHHHSGVTVLRRGLDASFLKTIPIIRFQSKDGLECAVCLSELQEGEKTRILPKCNHGFHVECIDMWFHSHSTCPICRNPVSEQTPISVETLLENHQQQSTNNVGDFPTNMLFWGDETEVSTLTSQLEETENLGFEQPATSSSSSSNNDNDNDRGKPAADLVIDIPREVVSEGDVDGYGTPVLSRMQSLRRILSNSRRFNPFSPTNTQH